MLNKVTLIGRLGGDPEPRSINNGIVVNFSLATTRRYTANGEKREETEWHRIVMFGKLAEIAEQWLNKDSLVYIEGRIQTRKWQDKQGVERYNTEIIAEQMQMLGGNNNAQQTRSNNSQSGYNNNSRQQTTRQSTPQNRQPEPETVDFNDDIPF